ncbi:MAG: hypothetical protein HYZ53_30545 [Planctomycetes bacterium]|nr:hypothetical protein [Planctomycetota bacterium]
MAVIRRSTFTLRQLLAVVLVLSLCVCIGIHVLAALRPRASSLHCCSNLMNLGNYLTLYVSRYGSDHDYPGTAFVGGSGAPVPAGPNGVFWAHLYRVPNQTNAVSQRPGDDGLYVCMEMPTRTGLAYSAPQFAATWSSGAPVFPGGRLSDATRGDACIGGDVADGPASLPTHHWATPPANGGKRWSCLSFDGHHEHIQPGTEAAARYQSQTTGARTR